MVSRLWNRKDSIMSQDPKSEISNVEISNFGRAIQDALSLRSIFFVTAGDNMEWITDNLVWMLANIKNGVQIIGMDNDSWYYHMLFGINYKFLDKHNISYHKLGTYAWMTEGNFYSLLDKKKSAGIDMQVLEISPLGDVPNTSVASILCLDNI